MQYFLLYLFLGFGNPRGNENPFLMSIGIVWFRYHNYMARKIKIDHPAWSDEEVKVFSPGVDFGLNN